MILGKIQDSQRIESLHPLFKSLFDYVKSHDLLHMPIGRIEIEGNDLFINNSDATLVAEEKQAIEVHQQYIDVHIPLDKTERIGWKALSDMGTPRAPFDKENDFALYDERPSTYVEVKPGEFLIVYPEDGHAPIIGEGKIRKAIAKVKIVL